MKNSEIELIYKMFDKIPKYFSISLQIQILKNKKILESEFSLISNIKKNMYLEEYVEYINKCRDVETKRNEKEIDFITFNNRINKLKEEYSKVINIQNVRIKEFESYLNQEFKDSDKLTYINVEELEDDINNLDQEFLDALLSITKIN